MTGYRIIWRCAVAAVSAAGALIAVILLAPATMIAVFVSSGLVCSLVTATVLALREEKQSGQLRRYARNALLGGAAGIAATGLAEVVGGFAILIVLVALAASPPAVRWYAVLLGEHRPVKSRTAYPEAKRHRTLSIEELCTAWTQSCLDLRGASPAQALRFVEARQYYLDELERRDPDGLRAWLATAASASGSPRRFISRRADG
jgi:MFS family permease